MRPSSCLQVSALLTGVLLRASSACTSDLSYRLAVTLKVFSLGLCAISRHQIKIVILICPFYVRWYEDLHKSTAVGRMPISHQRLE